MPIQVVETRNVEKTGYAPGIRVSSDMDLLFLSGISARPLDLGPDEPFDFPADIDEQTRMMFENIRTILDEVGITFRDIIKVVRFSTETGGGAVAAQYWQGWSPCSTTLGVQRLPYPGAKVMYDLTAVVPRST
jgi:enamine deaminase RidA (YjgF/YER057c/UK114 family)